MSANACVVGVALALAVVGTASATPANDPAANAANPVLAKSVGTGDINISPKRVVFGPNGRGATVYVFNRGTAPATYSIAVVDRAMMPDGRIEAIDDVNKNAAEASVAARVKSAKSLVIFTPRRVTLQPNESQTIRLRALRPSNLALGEYRTHLTVTALPPEDVGLTAEPLRSVLHDYFAWATTTTMARYHRSAADVPPGLTIPKWSWDGLQG